MTNTINIRASSIASIIDCPKRGLSLALGLVRQLPSTAPAAIGTACHAATAVFDQHRVDGDPISPDDAAGVLIESIRHPQEDVQWGDTSQQQAERVALGAYTRYCTDISPQLKYDHVEMSLQPLVVEMDGLDIELTGKLDRIYSAYYGTNGLGVLDIKSGARVLSQQPGKHKPQLAVYELLAERTLGEKINLPGLIGQLQTSSDYAVGVASVTGSRDALLGTDNEAGLLQAIASMLKSGDFYGNSSSWLCSPKYCALYNNCIFR